VPGPLHRPTHTSITDQTKRHYAETLTPGLRLVKEILLTREPEVAEFPLALRLFTRLAAHSAALSRRGTTVLQYRF
jgi:hypothetical protein